MLNPKLFEVYGEDSKMFFDEIISNTNMDEVNVCYALSDSVIHSGDYHGPGRIAVQTDNKNTILKVRDLCINCIRRMRDTDDEYGILCRKYDKESLERYGIKIWV